MVNDSECVKNFALICAAEAAGILPDELHEETKKREIAHARYVSMTLMRKFSNMTETQISQSFDCSMSQVNVCHAIKIVKSELELFGRKGVISDIVKMYRVSENMMKKEFKPRFWTGIPDV